MAVKDVLPRGATGAGIGAYFGIPGMTIGAAAGLGVGAFEEALGYWGNKQIMNQLGQTGAPDPLAAKRRTAQQGQLGVLGRTETNLLGLQEDALNLIAEKAILPGAQAIAATGASGLQASGAKQAQAAQAAALAGRESVQAKAGFEGQLLDVAMKKFGLQEKFATESQDAADAIVSQASLASEDPNVQRAIIKARANAMRETDPDLAGALDASLQFVA